MQFPAIRKTILQLLADGEFHSGAKLADMLNISRSAVWKQLNSLTEFGIEALAVSGKGYRLIRSLELLDSAKISRALDATAGSLLHELIIHDQISSTNTYLMQRASDGAQQGTVCLAEYQSAGKGRRGREWVSPFGTNIYLSLLWRYQAGPAVVSGLSLAAGVAVLRVLRRFGVDEAGLKWPNDIYWRDKKLGGILIEVSGETDGPCIVVAGIGLNLFLPAQQAQGITQPWTDLVSVLNERMPPRNVLAAALINEMLPAMAGFDTAGIAHYLPEWRSYDCMRGKTVSLVIGNEYRDGIVTGIDDSGLLLLQQTDGTVRAFASGEVSFRR